MSPAVTEIAQLPLLPNTDLHSGEGKKLLDSALEITARQPGLQRLFWGRQVENADVLVIVIGTLIISLPPLFSSLYQSTPTSTQPPIERVYLTQPP
jgi:hypothetical protein